MILVGDVGGTYVRLALADAPTNGRYVISDFHKYEANDLNSLDEAVCDYIQKRGFTPKTAVLAVAGPISNGTVKFTNRAWEVSQDTLSANCNIKNVSLINDFAAMARSVPELSDDSFINIQMGHEAKEAPLLVAGPGTGFGCATLLPEKNHWRVIPSEGGHISFAPETDIEIELLSVLKKEFGSVSVEHICGGATLAQFSKAVFAIYGKPYERVSPHDIIAKSEEGDEVCTAICTIRAHTVLRAVASMALVSGAQGGITIAGGVAKHLARHLLLPESIARYNNVWPQTDYLKNINLRLMTNSTAPLIGAAACAAQTTFAEVL